MSITYEDQQLDAVRAEARSSYDSYYRAVESIKGDRSLSDEGKSEQIARWHSSTEAKVAGLRERELSIVNDAITAREKQIDAKMGNTSSDLIAFRDAQDRAERIDSADDAQRIIERALRTNDASLAGAVFRRSLEAGWKAPVDALKHAKPEVSEAVADLALFTRFRDNTLGRAAAYSF